MRLPWSGATTSSWWCGQPRPGRFRPTWPPPCAPMPTTPGSRRRRDRLRRGRSARTRARARQPAGTRARIGAGRPRLQGPFDDLPATQGVEHRVVAWDEVSMEEGTGIVHIAPGCGAEDFELGQKEGLDDAAAGRRGGRRYQRLRMAARQAHRGGCPARDRGSRPAGTAGRGG